MAQDSVCFLFRSLGNGGGALVPDPPPGHLVASKQLSRFHGDRLTASLRASSALDTTVKAAKRTSLAACPHIPQPPSDRALPARGRPANLSFLDATQCRPTGPASVSCVTRALRGLPLNSEALREAVLLDPAPEESGPWTYVYIMLHGPPSEAPGLAVPRRALSHPPPAPLEPSSEAGCQERGLKRGGKRAAQCPGPQVVVCAENVSPSR